MNIEWAIVVEALPVDASPLLDHPIPKFQQTEGQSFAISLHGSR